MRTFNKLVEQAREASTLNSGKQATITTDENALDFSDRLGTPTQDITKADNTPPKSAQHNNTTTEHKDRDLLAGLGRYIITERRKYLISFLEDTYAKPRFMTDYAFMLAALDATGSLKNELISYPIDLHRSLEETFGREQVGDRRNISAVLVRLGSKGEESAGNDKTKFEQHKERILACIMKNEANAGN